MGYGKAMIVVLVLTALMSGCLGIGEQQAPPQGGGAQTQGETTVKRPALTIVSPLEDAIIKTVGDSTNVEVVLEAANLALKSPGGKNTVGEGHFHLMFDEGTEIVTINKKYIFENVAVGEHTLKVEIRQNDHTSYVPKIIKSVKFTVEKEVAEPEHREYTVTMKNKAYEPAEITIKVGDTVLWVNEDSMPHTATMSGKFDTSAIPMGGSAKVVFNTAGTYEYYSTLYPSMKGKITVVKK